MSRCLLVAELATNHGGDIALAEDMIRAAAEAGCDYAKTQAYEIGSLNPADPQYEWLRRSALTPGGHQRLLYECQNAGIQYLSTPFDVASLQMLRELGLTTFKIASSESGNDWWGPCSGEHWLISYPWGNQEGAHVPLQLHRTTRLTAIPLYPTPLEAVGRATLLDGWSDHTVGLDACLWAMAKGATVIEAHLKLEGRGRNCVWDKAPEEFRQLRTFADNVETMTSGVAQRFRERWVR